jgi:hypothetical protein
MLTFQRTTQRYIQGDRPLQGKIKIIVSPVVLFSETAGKIPIRAAGWWHSVA